MDQYEGNDKHDIIYTLRTIHQSQTQLINLADQKANVLLGIVGLMVTIVFTNYKNIFGSNDYWFIPSIIFIVLEGFAVFYSLLVIMPKTVNLTKTKNNKTLLHPSELHTLPNPLFFGFFTAATEKDFLDYIEKNMDDSAAARRFLARDIYQVGHVLKKKYALLKKAYTFAPLGVVVLVASAIGFAFE